MSGVGTRRGAPGQEHRTGTHSLLYLDRYRNGGTRVYSPHAAYTEAREAFRPDSPFSSFHLPFFRLPREELHVFQANPPAGISESYLSSDQVAFCVHPQILEEGVDDPFLRKTLEIGVPADPLPVAPSASTRTLYVLAREDTETPMEPFHALKVHFPFRISRYGRRMRKEVVEQAVNVSGELEGVVPNLDEGFAFLREVLGVAHRDPASESSRGENWGYLVRDMTPFPVRPGATGLVPGFALYGQDFFRQDLPPLVLELMGDRHPVPFILESIFLPIIRHWVRCYLSTGFILEPHGQNVLLEVDSGGEIRRIVHRDLSPGIDMRLRRDAGLGEAGLNTYNRMEDGTFASIAFDKMMGGHFFDRLVEAVLRVRPGLKVEDFRGPCREEFARILPEHEAYLPRTVQYFTEERDGFGKPHFQDTGRKPVWRP